MNLEIEKKLNILDLTPYSQTGRTVIFAPGWREHIGTNKENAKSISELGRRTITFEFKKDAEPEINDLDNKAIALNELITEKKLDHPDLILTSQAGIYGIKAAAENSTNIGNILLVDAAALSEPAEIPEVLWRFTVLSGQGLVTFFRHPKEYMPLWRNFFNVSSYTLRHPHAAVSETYQTYHADTYDLLEELAAKGVRVSVIAGVHDPLFPIKSTFNKLSELGYNNSNTPPFAGFYSLNGTHADRVTRTRTFAQLAVNALDGLERQRYGSI